MPHTMPHTTVPHTTATVQSHSAQHPNLVGLVGDDIVCMPHTMPQSATTVLSYSAQQSNLTPSQGPWTDPGTPATVSGGTDVHMKRDATVSGGTDVQMEKDAQRVPQERANFNFWPTAGQAWPAPEPPLLAVCLTPRLACNLLASASGTDTPLEHLPGDEVGVDGDVSHGERGVSVVCADKTDNGGDRSLSVSASWVRGSSVAAKETKRQRRRLPQCVLGALHTHTHTHTLSLSHTYLRARAHTHTHTHTSRARVCARTHTADA